MSSRSRWLLIPILFLGSTLTLTYLYFFQAALTEDRNHLQAHAAIISLELTRAAAVDLGSDDTALLTRNFNSLEVYLSQNDWKKIDQLGAGVIYSRKRASEENLYATCGLYSPLYMICDLSKDLSKTDP